jgi:hypothetical protein
MSATSNISEAVRGLFAEPARGVVGLVDDLLAACRGQGLQLEWQGDHCRVRSHGGGWDEVFDVPLRKSAFRAIIARVAALCNEQGSHPVSPYGGQSQLSVGTNPSSAFTVKFTNTASEQKLELLPAPNSAAENSRHTSGSEG